MLERIGAGVSGLVAGVGITRRPRKQPEYPAGGWRQMVSQGIKQSAGAWEIEADVSVINRGKMMLGHSLGALKSICSSQTFIQWSRWVYNGEKMEQRTRGEPTSPFSQMTSSGANRTQHTRKHRVLLTEWWELEKKGGMTSEWCRPSLRSEELKPGEWEGPAMLNWGRAAVRGIFKSKDPAKGTELAFSRKKRKKWPMYLSFVGCPALSLFLNVEGLPH